jgi:hypothetical protein
MHPRISRLVWSRWSWFAIVGALVAGKDACLGGGKRPQPVAPASASGTSGFATPPPSTPQPVPPG